MKNKIVIATMMAIMMVLGLFMPGQLFAEKFKGEDVSIVSELPPQMLNYRIHVGTDGSTDLFYKVSAVVTGVGETRASAVLNVDDANAVLSSTNTLQLYWPRVRDATSYNIYKSTIDADSGFYLLGNVAQGTYMLNDLGQSVGSAYSAPTVVGGNLIAEGDITAGGDLTVAGAIAFSGDVDLTASIVNVSSSATSTLSICFAGAFETLPTSGYDEGCLAYQGSDNTLYVSTNSVDESGDWKAAW